MARNRARLTKAITLKMVKPFMPWAPGAYAAFDFQNDRAIWTRQNILTYSQELDNAAWTASGATVTAGQGDAAGGTSAALIAGTSASEIFRRTSTDTVISGAGYTYSVALKRGNFDWIRLIVADSTSATNGVRVWFDLANGVVGSNGNSGTGYGYVSKSIAALGGGWYLCSVTVTAPTTTICVLHLSAASDGSTSRADVGGGAGVGTQYYIYRPQLEAGSEATAYIPTTAAAVNGNPERLRNLAATPNWTFTRASTGYALDLAGNLVAFASGALRRTDRGVLIEGARTNLCLQSQTFQTTWSRVNILAFGSGSTVDAAAAPDVTTTADLITEDTTATTQHRLDQTITVANATAHTFSIYAKANGRHIWLRLATSTTVANATFDLTAGTVAATIAGSATIEALANGWYRCTITGTSDSTTAICRVNLIQTNNSTADYTGNGTSGVYLWGAQLEAASFPSSYIPTTTASVTRAADALSITGVSGITYPLTGYVEFERLVDTATTEFLLQIDAGGSTDRVVASVETTDRFDTAVTAGGAGQGSSSPTGTIAAGSAARRGAFRVNTNSIRACLGGSLGTEDVSVTLPAQPSAIRIGSNHTPAGQPFNYLRRAAIWNSAFTDAQLQTQTT